MKIESLNLEIVGHKPRIPYADTKSTIQHRPFYQRLVLAAGHLATHPSCLRQTGRSLKNMRLFTIRPIISTGQPQVRLIENQRPPVTEHPRLNPPNSQANRVMRTASSSQNTVPTPEQNHRLVQHTTLKAKLRPNTPLVHLIESIESTQKEVALQNAIAEGSFTKTPMFKQLLALGAKQPEERGKKGNEVFEHIEGILYRALLKHLKEGSLLESGIYNELADLVHMDPRGGNAEATKEYATLVLDAIHGELADACMKAIIKTENARDQPVYRNLVELHAKNPQEFRDAGYPPFLNEIQRIAGERLGDEVLTTKKGEIQRAMQEGTPMIEQIRSHPAYQALEAFSKVETDFPDPDYLPAGRLHDPESTVVKLKYPWTTALDAAQMTIGKYLHGKILRTKLTSAMTKQNVKGLEVFKDHIRADAFRRRIDGTFNPVSDTRLRKNFYYRGMIESHTSSPALFAEVWGELPYEIHRALGQDVVKQMNSRSNPVPPLNNRTYHEILQLKQSHPSWYQEYAKNFIDDMHREMGCSIAENALDQGAVYRPELKQMFHTQILAQQMSMSGHWDEFYNHVLKKRESEDASYMDDITVPEDYAAKLVAELDDPERPFANTIGNPALQAAIPELHERCVDIIGHMESAFRIADKLTESAFRIGEELTTPDQPIGAIARKVTFKNESTIRVEDKKGKTHTRTYRTDRLGATSSQAYRIEKEEELNAREENRPMKLDLIRTEPSSLAPLIDEVTSEANDTTVDEPSSENQGHAPE